MFSRIQLPNSHIDKEGESVGSLVNLKYYSYES